MRRILIAATAAALAACTPPEQAAPQSEPHIVAELPPAVMAAVREARPDMIVAGFEYKERDGRRYYDVEGETPEGAEVELDLLQGEDGAWRVVEIQRDIAWSEAPAPVRAAAAAAPGAFEPARVIESVQAEDGSTIYELFAAGRPEAPALEVRWEDGTASILAEPNPH